MLSAIMVDEAAYLVFVFSTRITEFVGLVASIPAALFLLFAVLKTTSPVE